MHRAGPGLAPVLCAWACLVLLRPWCICMSQGESVYCKHSWDGMGGGNEKEGALSTLPMDRSPSRDWMHRQNSLTVTQDTIPCHPGLAAQCGTACPQRNRHPILQVRAWLKGGTQLDTLVVGKGKVGFLEKGAQELALEG